ncbi:(E)-beta-ocimene synthase, chloroplastic-like protein [Tanacetum coccineum]
MYPPTIWSHEFIESIDCNFQINNMEMVNELEKKVMVTFDGDNETGNMSTLHLLELIDTIENLGLGYRFQNIIRRELDKIASINGYNEWFKEEEDSLHAMSLRFRLLRQHGYNVSQDFLWRFKDSEGGFIGYLQTDCKGLLSLYEASYLAFEGDIDLHEAKLFATKHLLKLKDKENEVLEYIDHALELPLYRRVLRLHTRWWDISAVQQMPEYLKSGFVALYDTVNEMGSSLSITQVENITPVLVKVWGELLDAFFVEKKWSDDKYTPTLENYLEVALRSVSGVVILTHGYFLINQDIKKDVGSSLEKYQDLFKWSSMIFRLYNDWGTSLDEMKRGETINAISCYMHEKDVCEETARGYIKTLIDKAWMKLIELQVVCCQKSPDPVVDMAINIARLSHCTYHYGDGYGAPDARVKDQVLSVIVEPITIRDKEDYCTTNVPPSYTQQVSSNLVENTETTPHRVRCQARERIEKEKDEKPLKFKETSKFKVSSKSRKLKKTKAI